MIEGLRRPAHRLREPLLSALAIASFAASAALVLVAAVLMPPGYAWQSHSISESAAQGLEHAWVARLAFLLFGAGVLGVCAAQREKWSFVTYWANVIFAACMFGAAAFAHAPWLAGVPTDRLEDALHSVSATAMGFAFSAGVLARLLQRTGRARIGRMLDILALVAATTLPLVLATQSASGGLAQRSMFAVAYLWYGHEAWARLRSDPHA